MNIEDFLNHEGNRRQFLGSSAKNAAGMAAGMVGFTGVPAAASPNERVSVGIIGVRNRGKALAEAFAGSRHAEVTALCDIDEGQRAACAKRVEEAQGRRPRTEGDFRRLLDDPTLDAVVIATPDHWHASMTILACQAGKDVYVETPLAHDIDGGKRMIAAAARTGRVVQTGLQQRSGAHFRSAIAFVQRGQLGRVRLARAWTVHRRKAIGFRREQPVPAGVDYDLWLGPAPARPFQPNRFHYNWRWFWDYGCGELGNWGVHMLDIARWGLADVRFPMLGSGSASETNTEQATPIPKPELRTARLRVSSCGGKYHFQDDQETPDTQTVHFDFGDRTILWEHRHWSTHPPEGRSSGVAFHGELGTLVVDRGGWKVYDSKQPATADASELSGAHVRNFLDCVRTRATPTANILDGHDSSLLCHLGNISHRLGREVHFDPATGTFGDDGEANALLAGESRPEWRLPSV